MEPPGRPKGRSTAGEEPHGPPPVPQVTANTAHHFDSPMGPATPNSSGVLLRLPDGNGGLRLASSGGALMSPGPGPPATSSLVSPSPGGIDRIMLGFPSPAELTAPTLSATAPLHRRRPSRSNQNSSNINTPISVSTSMSFNGGAGAGSGGPSPASSTPHTAQPHSATGGDRSNLDPKKTDAEVGENTPLLAQQLPYVPPSPHYKKNASDDEFVPPTSLPYVASRGQRRSRPQISPAKQKGSPFASLSAPSFNWGGMSRIARQCLIAYVIISVIFTTWNVFGIFGGGSSGGNSTSKDSEDYRAGLAEGEDLELEKTIVVGVPGSMNNNYRQNEQHSSSSSSEVRMGKSGTSVVVQVGINDNARDSNPGVYSSMPDQYLLSKLFAHALKPVQIEPFFLRASSAPKSRDITVATIMDPSRMENFLRLVDRYPGPISAAVHVTENYNNVTDIINELNRVYRSHAGVAQRVDIHLVIDKFDRQFNLWRNVARFFARSDFVLQLDVDFVIPTNLIRTFMEHPDYLTNIDEHKTIYVLPAFEFSQSSAAAASLEQVEEFPHNKEKLTELWDAKQIRQFHDFFPVGHQSTDYGKWFQSDEPYAIQDYSFKYEPYVVMKKDETPWCDERFVGYGANKAACFYELFLAGYSFFVLPRDFVIHQRHRYPEQDRRIERNYNRELYRRFREEACIRYNMMFEEHGTRTETEARASATKGEEKIVEDFLGCSSLVGPAPVPHGFIPLEHCEIKESGHAWLKKHT